MKFSIFFAFVFMTVSVFANDAIVRARSTTVSPFSRSSMSVTKIRSTAQQTVDLINCFDDESFEVTYTSEKRLPFGGKMKRGLLKKYDLSSVNFVETSSGILCTIDDYKDHFFYVISQGKDGVFRITKEDKHLRGRRESFALKETAPYMSEFARFEPRFEPTFESNEKISIDVMVAYDFSARRWLNDYNMTETIHALSLVSQANTILENSGISSFEFTLVSVYPANFDFISKFKNISDFNEKTYKRFDSWLNIIRKGSHSAAKGILNERKKSGADVVSVVVYTGAPWGYLGMGYALYRTNESNFEKLAFSLTNVEFDASTFVHEIGHNMGAGHAQEQLSDPGPQYHSYSSGYYNNEAAVHTIMAYNDDGYGQNYLPIPAFSSSITFYKGMKIGSPISDNARTLTELAPMVSNFTKNIKNEFVAYGCIGTYDDRVRLAWTKIPGVASYEIIDKNANILKSTSSTSFTLKVTDSEMRTLTIKPLNRFKQAWGAPISINTVAKVCASPQWVVNTDTTFAGAAISVDEYKLPYDAPEVIKTPSFYMRYQDPFSKKMKKSAVVSRLPASRISPLRKFYVETTGKVNRVNRKLINPHRREGESFKSLCTQALFQPELNAYMFIKYKHVPFYTQTKLALKVPVPEIQSLAPHYNSLKKRWEIEIKGLYLSTKKPSVKFEYQYKNEFKTRSLSVISKPPFPNVRGQLNKSYTNVSTGESRLIVALPDKILLNQTPPYTLILDNGTAFTFKTFILPL